MRIFVGEYVCGGGLAGHAIDQIPLSLRREGAAMLRSVSTDLASVAETVVPLDARFASMPLNVTETIEIDPSAPLWGQWIEAAKNCDAALIVAPESDGVLAKAVAMLRAGGVDVIAGSGDFLRVASDKWLTAKTLISAGVAHPIYMTLNDKRFVKKLAKYNKFVVKPRDGCGTKEIKKFDSLEEARASLEKNGILQAWMPGRSISIALVASKTHTVFLPAVSQQLCDNTCEYTGGQGPLDDDAQRRATALAMRTIEVMPPTVRGIVGLDILLGERPSEDFVIEINPRLTTSYVGLRRMIHGNLAARLFDLETGPVSCCTPVDSVRWNSEGEVWINNAVAEFA
ncbi:carbamoyl phosphate synthase-like protein [Rubripirellula lacrimiformis]|uniref:Carbamoyl phosphate synthase-like protein n=1 Tax=Rubripirellula lacrimiformis TaxID=1930273 RepID=A0A517N9D7_9BACT|nr:ATP-grasp domain-containing protein [Rubripirellula lacrimiformis]QDT03741.1 carbamoyl phosphate synthase-like protein [Rubripirellula lacrimiformis]